MKATFFLLPLFPMFSAPTHGAQAAGSQGVAKIDRDRNRLSCETGFGACDHSLLSASELQEVSTLERAHNLLECETGEAFCNKSLLTPDELSEAARLDHQRQLLACRTEGYCETASLTASEKEEVDQAKEQYNDLACPAADVLCDRSWLGPAATSIRDSQNSNRVKNKTIAN
jgi:hypothetical protein